MHPPLHLGVVTNEKGVFGLLSTMVDNSTYLRPQGDQNKVEKCNHEFTKSPENLNKRMYENVQNLQPNQLLYKSHEKQESGINSRGDKHL